MTQNRAARNIRQNRKERRKRIVSIYFKRPRSKVRYNPK
jgi:hypothetical protein